MVGTCLYYGCIIGVGKMSKINHVGHNDRPDIAGEHPWGDTIQLIAFIIFLIVWIADSFFLKYSLYLKDIIAPGMRWIIGILNIASGFLLARNGLREVFGDIRENPIVIESGPFKYSRHPVYFGVILMYLGFVIATGSVISLILFLLITAFYYYISLHEEKLLIGKFGKNYVEYMERTPMLIPRVSKINRKLYIGFLLLFHAIIFTFSLNIEIFNLIGYLLYLVSAVYLLQGYKIYKENKK